MYNAKDLEIFAGGELPPNNIITGRTSQALVTRKSVATVLELLKRTLRIKDVSKQDARDVINFMNNLSTPNYEGMTYAQSLTNIVRDYIKWRQLKMDHDTDRKAIEQHEKKTIDTLTQDETPLKFSIFPKTHGTYFDTEERQKVIDEHKLKTATNDEVKIAIMTLCTQLSDVFSLDVRQQFLEKFHSMNVTYQSISTPHQTIVLDSRNKNTSTSDTYTASWNIKSLGTSNNTGDIYIKWPIEQVIRMEVNPFLMWITQPYGGIALLPNNPYGYYMSDFSKIYMEVVEFDSQSVRAIIPRGGSHTTKHIDYHFELTPQQRTFNERARLVSSSGNFTFQKPVAQVNSISVRFYWDFIPMPIIPDFFQFTNISKTGSSIKISGMTGPTAVLFKQIIYQITGVNLVNVSQVKYPKFISQISNKTAQLYQTPIHITYVNTGNSTTDSYLITDNGFVAALNVDDQNDVLTVDDGLVINVPDSLLASQPDFNLTLTGPYVDVYLDALSFTLSLDFTCLEMPPN
jgi:hypothetical protein